MNIGYFIENCLHFLPHIMPLVKETGGTILTFHRKTEKFIDEPSENYNIVYYKNYKHLLKDFNNLSIDVIVHPTFSIRHFKNIHGVKHIQVFHGTGSKPFDFHKSLRLYDLIAAPGPKLKEDILQKGLAEPDKIVVAGIYKIDSFLHSNFDSETFKRKIGIDNSKKMVLYAPTWCDPNRYSSFSKYIVSILRNLEDFNVIVKPHLNILKYRPWQILKAYIMKKKNCYIYPKSVSVLPFMAISDILITDLSAVSNEYLAFDKPMVFLCPKPIDKIPEEHRWIWQCGDIVEKKKDLAGVVKKNILNPSVFKTERDAALNQIFLDFDGKSALRFKNALIKLVDEEGR